MSDNYRRHVATRREIVFIEVPVAGSPKTLREVKPGRYPSNPREPWRPATRPPKLSKAEQAERIQRAKALSAQYRTELLV